MVYEQDNCKDCADEVANSSLWALLENISVYKKPVDSIRNRVKKIISDSRGVLVSAHLTKKDEIDFFFYVPSIAARNLTKDIARLKKH